MLSAHAIAQMTKAKESDVARFLPFMPEAFERFEITTPARQAAWFATVAVESNYFRSTEESLYYRDPARLFSIYMRAFKTVEDARPYARNPSALSKLLYGGYHGRGLIQLTWLKNYERASEALGEDFVKYPQLVKEPEWAVKTAAWYFHEFGCLAPADAGNMTEVTRRVNGPRLMHLKERLAVYHDATEVLGRMA